MDIPWLASDIKLNDIKSWCIIFLIQNHITLNIGCLKRNWGKRCKKATWRLRTSLDTLIIFRSRISIVKSIVSKHAMSHPWGWGIYYQCWLPICDTRTCKISIKSHCSICNKLSVSKSCPCSLHRLKFYLVINWALFQPVDILVTRVARCPHSCY